MSLTLSDKVAIALRELPAGEWAVHADTLWYLLQERPEAHFDDTAPHSVSTFLAALQARQESGERLFGIEDDGTLIGAIGYRPISADTGMLHGVSVARCYSGRGIADAMLRALLETLRAEGVRKVSAAYFADNPYIRACLKRVGFVDEGFLQDQTTRGGVPVSMWLVAILLNG
jgi:RimJ/RimL family protein N-acetyltransferase